MNLHTPVKTAGGFYKRYASLLEKLGITTFYDLLFHLPFRYEDYSLISKIQMVQPGETVTIQGNVTSIKNEYLKGFKKLQKAKVTDETGEIEIVWFNQPYIAKIIRPGDKISLSGQVSKFAKILKMESPEYEILTRETQTIHTGRLVPIYPETKGISSKWLRRQIYKLLQYENHFYEYLPEAILASYSFMSFFDALRTVHFPKTLQEAEQAKQRLAFDELFFMQLASLQRRKIWEENLTTNPFKINTYQKHLRLFYDKLPFTLTNTQKKSLDDIFNDLAKNKPMNRLLEGDVGSGKTIVSAVAMYLAHLNGFQSVLMAPTEILAQQHYNTILNLLEPLGLKVGLATGSRKIGIKNQESGIKEKKSHNSSFIIHNSNNFDILIGTHAVLSEKINFDKLGLVVIDEQQRFGVEQRSIIRKKGENPHLLTMTATPIPRTIALTMYGDLDVSYLNELPAGRKKIKTWLVPRQKRDNAYEWIRKQTKQEDQVFIICPFIEESENMQTVKAASKEYERLQKEVFPDLKIGLLHGKLKSKEKDQILQQFKEKKFNILVATPVVEVGIDIPNATVILIEASERFGLSQLHQLRGRVGRGDKQSYCLLFTESANPQTIQRLKAMETTQLGAELAELDLKLRGPGELYGTMQHGSMRLKVASFSDFALIEKTQKEAKAIFPEIAKYPLIQEKLTMITLKEVSPD